MNETNGLVGAQLASLARTTLAAAPRPAPPGAVRILAERRRAAVASRRLFGLVMVASAVPIAVIPLAWALRPTAQGPALVALSLLALALGPAIGLLARTASMGASARGGIGSGRHA
jgi:hypothetical protein